MAGKAIQAKAEIALANGMFVLTAAELQALEPLDGDKGVARAGIVLLNERVKDVYIMHEERDAAGTVIAQHPVLYTASIYVQRAPITEDELDAVKVKAEDIDGKKKTKAEEEQTKKTREVRAAFELGQSATLTNLTNIGTLVQAANALEIARR